MTDQRTIERRTTALLSEVAPARAPDRLYADVLTSIGRTRQRARWLAYLKEPPMRISSRLAVGSPTFRLASLMTLTLLLTVLATGAVVTGASLLPGAVIVVAQDGMGTVRTITEAVAMARDGDTVLVKPGTYLESIVITEDISLRGDGDKAAVIIEFAAAGPTHPVDEEQGAFAYGILLADSKAHVVNLTLHGRPDGAGGRALSAVVVDGGAPVLEHLDVILDDDPFPNYPWHMRSAFQITGGSTAVVRTTSWDGFTRIVGLANSPTFEGNTMSAQRMSIWGAGHRVTISGNSFLDGAGILWTDPGSSGTVVDNDIVGWIGGFAGDGTIIRGNRIRDGGEPRDGRPASAIEINTADAIVEGNEITDSPYGIDVWGSGAKAQISGNTIRGSSVAAILVDLGAAPTIEGNVIEGNATGVQVNGATTTPVLRGNTLCGNGTDLTVPEGSTLTLDGNTICAATP